MIPYPKKKLTKVVFQKILINQNMDYLKRLFFAKDV